MLCTFKRLIYPKVPPPEDSGYRIALYQPCEKLRDAAGRPVTEVKAVGFFLPTGENLPYELKGRWARDTKYGVQFEVEGYEEIIAPTKEGIVGYLSSGQIKGIGPKTAEKIFQAFGMDTLRILDEEPERLLSIPGISAGKLKKIQESYLANRGARDVVAFLVPHGVTPNRAVKVYQAFGKEAMDILRRHPYRLCEVAGIGFLTADQIARSLGLDPRSPERVDAALLHTLQEAEQRGHLCLEKHDLLRQSLKLLRTEGLTEAMAAVRAGRLVEENKLVTYHQWVYRWPTARAEMKLAQWIAALLQRGTLCRWRRQPSPKALRCGERAGDGPQRPAANGGAHRHPQPGDYPHRRPRHRENPDPTGLAGPVQKALPQQHRAVLRPHRPGRPPDGGIHRRARSHYS